MRITFQEVRLYGEKSIKCAGGCGRRLKRQKKFYQTLSPFNKRPDGVVKNHDDIYPELKTALAVWRAKPETCGHCMAEERKEND